MKYALKQKWMSLGDVFPIVDEKGREAFLVEGAALKSGKRLSFRDHDDTELAFINPKVQSFGQTYEIYHGDDLQSVVRKDAFSTKRCRFAGESAAPDDLHAEGNFTAHEYTFTREGRPVGRVSKSLFHRRGTYGVEVDRGEDELLLLASAVVIDLCCHDRRPVLG